MDGWMVSRQKKGTNEQTKEKRGRKGRRKKVLSIAVLL
jgi:hypothetical protein